MKILGITVFVKLVQAILILFLIFNLGRRKGPWTTNPDLCIINSSRSIHRDHNNEIRFENKIIMK